MINGVNGFKDHQEIEKNTQEIKIFMQYNTSSKNINKNIFKKDHTLILLHFNYLKTFQVLFYLITTMLKYNTNSQHISLIIRISKIHKYNIYH